MKSNPEGRSSKDIFERFGDLTFRAQAIGAAAFTLVGFMPGAVLLGTGAALDYAGNTLYKQARDHTRRKLGGVEVFVPLATTSKCSGSLRRASV